MNERIKLLARRAGFDVERMEINHANGNPSMAEQFAELIIKECIDTIVRDTANYPGEGMMAYYQGVQDAGKSIKQHFGVEE